MAEAWTQRDLVEEVGRQLGVADAGRWRLELTFEDGRLQHVYRHEEKIPASRYARPLEALPGLLRVAAG